MENVKGNEVAGAMYAFPRITLPKNGQYKTWTVDCGLRTTDCGLGIKRGLENTDWV